MGLPSPLDAALANIDNPSMPHVGGDANLPLPGLRVKGLDEYVALPLLPAQAEKLAEVAHVCPHGKGLETVVDTAVRDCLEIDPEAISFANKSFQIGIDNLAKKAMVLLRVPTGNVKWSLYKMLLYRTGGHFKPHRDTEKIKGMFATLTVQLPSCFKGGELVVRHQGQEEVYDGGADDGRNEFGSFYTACFADLEHQILPVKEGYRLALVYSLYWTGQGDPPSADENNITPVTRALKKHAALFQRGAWVLAFNLGHQYTESSLESLGTSALKGVDRRNVEALTAAAELAGMGPLEVLICKLSRTNVELGVGGDSPYDGGYFQAHQEEMGDISVETAYSADGSEFSDCLTFVDWYELADFDIEFKPEGAGEVEHCIGEGAFRTTTYGAMTVIMWPKNKDIEVRFNDSSDVCAFLNDGPSEAFAVRCDRLLSCLEESELIPRNAWKQANALLQSTIEHNLAQQTSRGIKFMSRIRDTPGVEMVLTDCLSTFGWASVGDAVKMYLCPTDPGAVNSVDGRIQTIRKLRNMIPFDITCQGLDTVLKVLESKWSVLLKRQGPTGYCNEFNKKRISGMWNSLMSVLATFESMTKDDQLKKFDVEKFVSSLIALLGKFNESEIEPFQSALGPSKTDAKLEQCGRLHSAVEDRCHALRTERFVRETKLTLENKAPSPSRNLNPAYRSYNLMTNWGPFLSLVAGVFSREPVPDEATEQLQAFMSALPSFTKPDIDVILSEVIKLGLLSKGSTALSKVKESASRIQDRMERELMRQRDLKTVEALRSRVKTLVQATRIAPPNVNVKYTGISIPGYPRIGQFLAGNGMEERITGFHSLITARNVLKSFQSRLPQGVYGFAGGSGRHSFIKLTKPFAAERRVSVAYEKNVRILENIRVEVAATEARLRRPVDADEDQPARKVPKVGDSSTTGVGEKGDGGDLAIMGEKISPKKANDPQVID